MAMMNQNVEFFGITVQWCSTSFSLISRRLDIGYSMQKKLSRGLDIFNEFLEIFPGNLSLAPLALASRPVLERNGYPREHITFRLLRRFGGPDKGFAQQRPGPPKCGGGLAWE
jgi:hypothetical protein